MRAAMYRNNYGSRVCRRQHRAIVPKVTEGFFFAREARGYGPAFGIAAVLSSQAERPLDGKRSLLNGMVDQPHACASGACGRCKDAIYMDLKVF